MASLNFTEKLARPLKLILGVNFKLSNCILLNSWFKATSVVFFFKVPFVGKTVTITLDKVAVSTSLYTASNDVLLNV